MNFFTEGSISIPVMGNRARYPARVLHLSGRESLLSIINRHWPFTLHKPLLTGMPVFLKLFSRTAILSSPAILLSSGYNFSAFIANGNRKTGAAKKSMAAPAYKSILCCFLQAQELCQDQKAWQDSLWRPLRKDALMAFRL